MHRKYINVHLVLQGEEEIGWKSTDDIVIYPFRM
ncbi:YhcH/YjgK/YiaL family protein [Bacteroides zoogleoformans]